LNIQIQEAQENNEKQLKIKDAFFAEKNIRKMKSIPKNRIRPWLQ
jgi:hypothetical protein